MKIKRLLYILPACCLSLLSCESDYIPGDSLIRGEVAIDIDSTFVVTGHSIYNPQIKTKSMTQLIGNLSIPEYGDLSCSFVTQFMPAESLNIPDSIPLEDIKSMRLRFRFANMSFTGDSLAPQQLKIYRLTKQLPNDIMNDFDPTGYYNPNSPLGVKSYTASHLGMADKVYKGQYYGDSFSPTWERAIWVDLPKEFALNVVKEYRDNPSTFQTPSSFSEYFHGIYVEPYFGNGLVVDITNTEVITYYNYTRKVTVLENNQSITKDSVMTDSVTLFCVSPEIISSNNIKYNVSDNIKNKINEGQAIVSAPAGYNVEISFPTEEIIDKYVLSNANMSVVNNLTISIPVENIKNDYGLTPPPYLLMVKSSEVDKFFAENIIPDGKSSFWASYDESSQSYNFTSMRDYIIQAIKERNKKEDDSKKEESEDYKFTIIPVQITTDTQGTYETTTIVTKCTPFISRPVMGRLVLDKAKVKFTYSKQNQRK